MDKIQKTEMEEDDWELIKVLEEAEGWNFEIFNIFSNFFRKKRKKEEANAASDSNGNWAKWKRTTNTEGRNIDYNRLPHDCIDLVLRTPKSYQSKLWVHPVEFLGPEKQFEKNLEYDLWMTESQVWTH